MPVNLIQIVHWKHFLKFPEDSRLSPEAKDLICRLLCDVEHRLGTEGSDQIKVLSFLPWSTNKQILTIFIIGYVVSFIVSSSLL